MNSPVVPATARRRPRPAVPERTLSYVEAIREATDLEMARDPAVILFGLDVDDPKAIQGTVRAIWAGLEHSRQQAIDLGYAFVAMGTNQDSIREGQEFFASGTRIEWRLR